MLKSQDYGRFIAQILSIYIAEFTVEFVTSIITMILPTVGTLFLMFIRFKHVDKFKELFERMWADWALQKTDDEIKIMHEHAEITRLYTLFCLCSGYLGVITFNIYLYTPEILDIISPMNESRQRIQLSYFRVGFFSDEERYLYFIRFVIFISSVFVPLIVGTCFLQFVVFTQHVCAMCKLLGYRAECLFSIVGNTKKCDSFCRTKIYCEKITVFVQLHNSIIQFIRILDSCYTIPCIMELIVCMIVTSVSSMLI
ncbi:uncharacterized protein [Anoplolepis gracilipes]|uniref:uncharacterized protein n=1 Tax=Anoplolepis gracilipes TaxID=354296 RepID=UPI003B9EE644